MSTLPFSLLAIALYLVSSSYIGKQLWQNTLSKTPWLIGIAALASISHTFALFPALLTDQGLHLGFFNAASLIALFIVVLVILCNKHLTLNVLLAPIQVIAALTIACAQFLPYGHMQPINEAPGILAHIIFSVLAYGVISIAVVQSLLLLIQERQLRKRPVSAWLRSFPPLQTMESLLFSYLWSGWLLLSLSLLTGWLFLEDFFAQHLAHKTLLSSLAWVIFAVLLWGRHRLGWRGHKAIRLTLAGFSLLMLAYFGSKLVREFILTS